ncbi:MAG: hypothetical protein PHX38_07900 [Sulfuricella sp.]|nr:hypothetical protein [Sulfuricella sp.]
MTTNPRTTIARRQIAMRRHRGFTIVSAIFLLVVLAGLGAAIANVSMMQHTSSALDVQGARAYQAARTGIEWGAYRQMINTSCAGATSFVPPAPSLGTFTVTVTCTSTTNPNITVGNNTVYQITSNACNNPNAAEPRCPGAAGGVDYVERELQVTF